MMNELFQQALNISPPWFIKSVEFKAENKRLDIYVDFIPGSTFSEKAAPEKAYKAYDTIEKTWRHLNFSSMNVTYMLEFLVLSEMTVKLE